MYVLKFARSLHLFVALKDIEFLKSGTRTSSMHPFAAVCVLQSTTAVTIFGNRPISKSLVE